MRNHPSPLLRSRPRPERTSSVTRVVKPASSRASRAEQPMPSSSQFIMKSSIPQIPELDIKKESSSLFKENQRLKAENARLQESMSKMQEELQSRDVFAQTLSNIDTERYDTRRLAMYRAKTFKQERMVVTKQIELLTTALESQKGLYFEIDTLIRSILEISKRTEKAEENLVSITCLVSASKKKLREVEKNIKIAYSQLISSTTDSAPVYDTDIDISQKLTLKLDGKLILETEEALNELLIDLQDEPRTLQQGKIRIAAQKLLALGMKLPMGRIPDSDQLLNQEEKRILHSESNKDSQRIIKAVLNRFYQHRKQLQMEISNYSKEAEQNKKAYLDLKRRMEQSMSSSLLIGRD